MPPPGLDDGREGKSFLHIFKTILRTSCNALHSIEKEVRSPLCRDPPSAMVVVVVVVDVLVAVAVFVVVGRWLLVVGCC